MIRANISLICGSDSEAKQNYLEDIKNKKIQHRVVSYEKKALELYSTTKLTKQKRDRVIRLCGNDVDNYLLEGQNIIIDIPFNKKKDRIDFLYTRRKFMRENLIRCWCSVIILGNNKVEMPEENEGWNDILLPKNNTYNIFHCHDRLIF